MTTEYQSKPQPETARAAIEALGLRMAAEFVPYSLAKHHDDAGASGVNRLTINWTCDIKRNGRDVLTTPFSQGIGHLPNANKNPFHKMTVDEAEAIRKAVETGYMGGVRKLEPPTIQDVLHCLISDAEAIDRPTFEEWASDLGYDTDSRKAEATYRACLEIGLKLRAALGNEGLRQLREAFQDY